MTNRLALALLALCSCACLPVIKSPCPPDRKVCLGADFKPFCIPHGESCEPEKPIPVPPPPMPEPTPTPVPTPTPTPTPKPTCETIECPTGHDCVMQVQPDLGPVCVPRPVIPPPAPEPIPPPPGPVCGPPPQGVPLCNTDDNVPSCGCWKCGPKSDFKWEQKAPCPVIPSGPDPCKTCWKCADLIQYQVRRGHLTPVQVTKGPKLGEIIYTDGTGSGKYVNKSCETVTDRGDFLYPPSAFLGGACWPYPAQCEGGPTPTPAPVPQPPPSPEPTPPPPSLPAECPWQDGSSLSWVGIVSRGNVPIKTQGGVYLGKRYNFDATPHSKGSEFCKFHRPDQQQCDQLEACQDPLGPDFYMTLPGKWKNERCDKNSSNNYQCHHKPKADEVGATTVCAVPRGDRPDSPRGRCVTVDVR